MSKHGSLITVASDQDGAGLRVVTETNGFPCQIVGTNGVVADVDGLGHLSVIPHAHEEGGHLLFETTLSTSQDFIVLDLSDTTNYPHDNTLWAHFSNLVIGVDASNTADYVLELGFLANVDATNSDFIHIYKWSGTRATGNTFREVIATNPEGVKARASSNAGKKDLNDTAFNTATNLATTLDPAAANTPSGEGDIVLRATVTTGTITIDLGIVYHSHSV